MKKNKLLFTILFLFFILFFCNSYVNASIVCDGKTFPDNPSSYSNFCVYYDGSSYYLIANSSGLYGYVDGNNLFFEITSKSNQDINGNWIEPSPHELYKFLDNEWSYQGLVGEAFSNSKYGICYTHKHLNLLTNGSLLYSTFDITLADGTTIFFPVPVTGVVIPALETAQEVPTAMVQTLKIIIPVGLVLFGIGLSVYLIRRILS